MWNVPQIAETSIIETRTITGSVGTAVVGDEEREGLGAGDKNRRREGRAGYVVTRVEENNVARVRVFSYTFVCEAQYGRQGLIDHSARNLRGWVCPGDIVDSNTRDGGVV